MPTKTEVLSLLRSLGSYEEVGRVLRIPAGQAYLVATGMPADGSGTAPGEELAPPGLQLGSTQELANPPLVDSSKASQALAFLRRRALEDTALREAAALRTAEPPEMVLPEDDEERFDVVDVLGRDHNQVKYLLQQVEAIPAASEGGTEADGSRRQSIVDMMTKALVGHEAAEEAYFWPAVRSWLADGSALAEEATAQEAEAAKTLLELSGLDGSDEKFDELVQNLSKQLRMHVAFEDRVLLRVEESVDILQRVATGRDISEFKGRAPTRPHRGIGSAPAKPTAAVAVADKVRDAVGTRPAKRKGRAEGEQEGEA